MFKSTKWQDISQHDNLLNSVNLSKAYFAAVLEIDPGHEEAKGLLDIMASLERQQPGNDDR